MRIIHVVLAGWMLITVSNTCFGKEWRGITPLKSSRADVERLLGRPTGPLPTYYLSDVTVTFWYSRCRCGEKSEDDCWNVPGDTVVSIYVTLKGVNRLADLGLDLTRFKKTQGDYDVPGSFRYSNAEEGFGLEGGDEYVSALIYGPRTKDEHLRCPRDSSRPAKSNCSPTPTRPDWHGASLRAESEQYYDLFQRYDDADNIERRRQKLQSYAGQLRDDQMYDAWIRSYAGRRACVLEAKRRGEEAKAYLFRHGINEDRIKVIDGGFLNNWSVDLWLVIRGKPGPPPLPTLKRKEIRIIKSKSKCPKLGTPSI